MKTTTKTKLKTDHGSHVYRRRREYVEALITQTQIQLIKLDKLHQAEPNNGRPNQTLDMTIKLYARIVAIMTDDPTVTPEQVMLELEDVLGAHSWSV